MTIRPAALTTLATLLALGSPCAAQAAEAGIRYASWQGCLDRNFGLQASLGSRLLAADAALLACRDAQAAYLTALAASPMLDADDVTQVQGRLVARAKGRLLGRRAAL